MALTLATYNINSVRLRAERVKHVLQQYNLDILCLQETKVQDKDFPLQYFQDLGYEHVIYSGEKSYNGVAIISRIPLSNPRVETFVNEDKRHISATLPDGTELHNFYIPAGGDEPDPAINPKFKHKLSFVEEMTEWFKAHRSPSHPIIIVGDFNIAPLEHDVWSHKQLLKIVSHTPEEVSRLKALQDSLQWVDTAREFTDKSEKLYSWWSYRNRDWRKSNRGRRLDHIWITPTLKPKLVGSYILRDERDGFKPSDHVPVVAEFNL